MITKEVLDAMENNELVQLSKDNIIWNDYDINSSIITLNYIRDYFWRVKPKPVKVEFSAYCDASNLIKLTPVTWFNCTTLSEIENINTYKHKVKITVEVIE